MDQETGNKSGSRGSWRDRLGINEASAAPEKPSTPSAAPAAKPAPRVEAKVVATPAPMAPRPGAAVKAPQRPAAPSPAPAPVAPPAPRSEQDNAFAERLRQHRAAAEEAVKKRSPTSSLEKFSFAKNEVAKAEIEIKQETEAVAPQVARPPVAPVAPVPSPRPAMAPAQASATPRPQYQQPQVQIPAPRPVQAQPPRAPAPPPPPQYTQRPANPYNPQPHPQQPAYRPQAPGGYAPPQGGYPGQPAQGYNAPGQGQPQAYGRQPVGYAPSAPGQRPPAPVARQMPPQAPRYTPGLGDDDLFEDNGYRPAGPIGRAPAPAPAPTLGGRPNDTLRANFDDPFDDNREYNGRSASEYSQAYREFDDDFEEEAPRKWGGLIMIILALLTIAALGAGMIFWYQANKAPSSGASGEVPTIGAPEQPVKAAPEASTEQPATAPAQGKKLIYERILGTDGAAQPEQIVPREETPAVPPASSEGGNALPLPLPPPPGTQGSLTPGTAGPEPAQQTANVENNLQQDQGAVGVEPAASAVEGQSGSNTGAIGRPPIPRKKPNNLVASVTQAPATQFRPVLQPTPVPQVPAQQFNPPLQPLQQQSASVDTSVPAPAAPQPEPTRRGASRDDDPLAGLRAPLNSNGQAPAQQQAPQELIPQQQPAQQQVALAPQPAPQPAPQQQPITSQSLQSFAPPSPDQQQQASTSGTGGYVVQLAAYRSEQEAMGQYQQLRSRHGNLVGNLPPAVQQTNLGASGTFYRLGMGPMSSKQAATELCNKLIAAGERDCLVRRR